MGTSWFHLIIDCRKQREHFCQNKKSMNKIKQIIDKHSTENKVLWFFILSTLIYLSMLLFTVPKVMHFSNGMYVLDMMLTGYDSAYIHSLFETLGKKGRHTYLYYQLPIDMIYPLSYMVSFSFLIAYFLKKLSKFNSTFFYLCFLPIIAGIADYLENIGTITMLNTYPCMSEAVMASTNIFTIIKSMTVTLTLTVLIILIMMAFLKAVKVRKTTAHSKHS